MVSYENAIKRPFSDIKNLIIGILLSILPVIRWISLGYILNNSGIKKEKIDTSKLQEWTNIGDLFVKGLLGWVIKAIYMIPIGIVFLIGAGSIFMNMIREFFYGRTMIDFMMNRNTNEIMARMIYPPGMMNILFNPAFVTTLIVCAILFVLIVYIYPAAVLNYIKTNNFGDAFKLKEISKKAFTSNYFVVWLIAVIISALVFIILSWIPWIGFAISFFVTGVFSYTIIAEVLKEGAKVEAAAKIPAAKKIAKPAKKSKPKKKAGKKKR